MSTCGGGVIGFCFFMCGGFLDVVKIKESCFEKTNYFFRILDAVIP